MNYFKEMKWNSVLTSIVMIALGIVLILFPGISLNILMTALGIIGIVVGAIDVIRYLTLDVKESYYRNDFLYGVIILTFGLLVIFKPSLFISIIPFILGLFIIFSSFHKLQDGIDAKRIGYDGAIWYIILAIIGIIFGVIILFDPLNFANAIFIVIGIALVYSGISDLYVTFYLSKRFKDLYDKM